MSDIEVREIEEVTSVPTMEAGTVPETPAEAEAPAEPEMIEVMAQEAYFLKDGVQMIMDNGMSKFLTYEAFMSVMREATNALEASKSNTFLLPPNVFYFNQSSSTITISMYYPEDIRNLHYYSEKKRIITPNIIVSHTLRAKANGSKGGEWVVEQSRYFCTNQSIGSLPTDFIWGANPSKSIWLLPMTNTYNEGTVCYGGNQMPHRMTDNNLRPLDWYFRFLWESPFNDDLGIRAIRNTLSPSSWYTLLQKEAEKSKPTFPYDRLR